MASWYQYRYRLLAVFIVRWSISKKKFVNRTFSSSLRQLKWWWLMEACLLCYLLCELLRAAAHNDGFNESRKFNRCERILKVPLKTQICVSNFNVSLHKRVFINFSFLLHYFFTVVFSGVTYFLFVC